MKLQGKTAIVTGGASGFGAGIVRRFVEEGARVMIVDINADAAKANDALRMREIDPDDRVNDDDDEGDSNESDDDGGVNGVLTTVALLMSLILTIWA